MTQENEQEKIRRDWQCSVCLRLILRSHHKKDLNLLKIAALNHFKIILYLVLIVAAAAAITTTTAD
jgi:hypothetical protein